MFLILHLTRAKVIDTRKPVNCSLFFLHSFYLDNSEDASSLLDNIIYREENDFINF